MQLEPTLLKKMLNKEQDAFQRCYEQTSPIVYSIILRICRCKASAQDILQDTYIQAFSRLHTLKDSTQFISWLKRIAFNNTISWIRKNSKHLINSNDFENENIADLTNTNDIAQQHEIHNDMSKLLTRLPPQARLILWLYVVEGYSHQEIATMNSKSISYSKTIVSRALGQLKENSEVQYHAK